MGFTCTFESGSRARCNLRLLNTLLYFLRSRPQSTEFGFPDRLLKTTLPRVEQKTWPICLGFSRRALESNTSELNGISWKCQGRIPKLRCPVGR